MSDPAKAVFLSYASQDAEAARRICETLRASGIEVWFDADGGLEHGDEWDAKIRRQIKECVLFIVVISANTQARHEGYFRIEWDLAAERARGIASGVAFILPVVIDDTREPDALVPDRFRAVQWTRLPGGVVPPEVQQRFLKLWSHRTGVAKQAALEAGRAHPAQRDEGVASPVPSEVGRPLRGRLPWLAGAAAALALLGALGWKFLPRDAASVSPPEAVRRSAPPTPEKSVAVLPFANQSDDKANEYFSDGIADELLTVLQKIPGQLAPDDADVLTDACTVGQAFGDWAHSIAAGRRAVSLDPVNPEPRLFLAISFFHSGRLPEAEVEIRRACELAPAGVFLRLIACQFLVAADRAEEALAEAKQETGRMHLLELAEFACGRRSESDAALTALEREFGDAGPFQIAEVYAARHDPTPAFKWLEHAWQVKDPGTGWTRVAATLKNLHRDPRWPVFLKKIGLHDEQLK